MKNICKGLIFVFLLLLSACSSGISEEDYSTLQQECSALQEENADLKAQLEDAKQRNSELVSEIYLTSAKLAEAQQAQADAEAALEDVKTQAVSQPTRDSSDSLSSRTSSNSTSIDSTETTDSMVWVSKTGKKYHSSPNCSNMKNPSQISLATAQARGLTPCSKCY